MPNGAGGGLPGEIPELGFAPEEYTAGAYPVAGPELPAAGATEPVYQGTGGMGPVAEPAGIPGAGGAPPGGEEGILQEHTEMTARAAAGESGVGKVHELRASGVPEATIRQRLGLGATLPAAPPARAPAPRAAAAPGVAGAYLAPSDMPEYLQREFKLYYPPDFESKVAAAAVAGDITNEQAKRLMGQYRQWEQSPIAEPMKQRVAGLEAAEEQARTEADFAKRALAAQNEASQAKQAVLAQQRADLEAEANLQRAWQDDYDREFARVSADYDRAVEEAKRARIDPDRARVPIFDALAAAAGQFAAILTGTPNAALDIINRRLDRDIESQEKNIGRLDSNVAAQRNRLGLLRQRLGDRELAKQTEKRLQLEQVQNELQRVATRSPIELNRLGAEKLSKDLEVGIAALRQQEQAAQQQIAQQIANAAQIARTRQAQAAQQAKTGMGPWQTGGASKMQGRYIPGFGFVASEKAATEIRDNLSKFDTTIGAFEGLLRIAEVPGAATDPEMRARAQSLVSQADLGLAVANNLGAISASDAEFVKNQRGNPAALFEIGGKTRLQQTLGDLRRNRSKALARHHFTPGEMSTTMQRTKRGDVEPALSYRLGLPGTQMQQPGAAIQEREVAP